MNRVPDRERLLQQIRQEKDRFIGQKGQDILLEYALTFNNEHGRKVLEDWEKSWGGIAFVPGYPDVTAWNDAMRSFPFMIRQILKMAEELRISAPPPTDKGR